MQGSQGQLDKEEELRYRMHQGRPHLFTDMRITNDEGHEMPHDGKATGELEVRGPHVVKAYFRVTPLPMLYHEHACKLRCHGYRIGSRQHQMQ